MITNLILLLGLECTEFEDYTRCENEEIICIEYFENESEFKCYWRK